MKIYSHEKNAMCNILMRKHGCTKKKALELIEEYNGGVLKEVAKRVREKRREEKRKRGSNFLKKFRDMKNAKTN